ncbi:UNVERIFIED_CONTAM: hypothetical protein FKN15_033068 [Acipenser sinensis]
MFYQSDPDRFGTMFNTIFTLFQLLTLDDWSYIYTTSRERDAQQGPGSTALQLIRGHRCRARSWPLTLPSAHEALTLQSSPASWVTVRH